MKKLPLFAAVSVIVSSSLWSTAQAESTSQTPMTLHSTTVGNILLPHTLNSPASVALDEQQNIYFTSPNFHNDALVKLGEVKAEQAPAPRIAQIDNNDQVSDWYVFQPEDMEKTSGKVAPMGIAFGPDGNAYVPDMQLWFGGESRLLRINVENGKAISMDVVATGFSFPNGLVWKGNDLFIADTVLDDTGEKTISGNYKVSLDELNADNPLEVRTYKDENDHDPHLFDTFVSNGSLKFGANGVTTDNEGNLYTTMMEDGSVLKTTFDAEGNKLKTETFADGLIAIDGIQYDKATNRLYTTDLFANAAYAIDMAGNTILLAENEDSDGRDGLLDAPSEVAVRGNKVYVMNFDAVFDNPNMKNKTVDAVHNISVLELK